MYDYSLVDTILTGLKAEAEAVDFYERLAASAPAHSQKTMILDAAQRKKARLHQWSDLYTRMTGTYPDYTVEEVDFDSYVDGLNKAYEREVEAYEHFRQGLELTRHSPLGGLFWRTCHEDAAFAERFNCLANDNLELKDYGGEPYVVNIDEAARQNETFRTALWTGEHLQVTLMSIEVGGDIGLEVHPEVDQFLRIEEGEGLVQMGPGEDQLDFEKEVEDDDAIMVPAGTWHNLTNTGEIPLKLYTIYAPPEHPFGTVHETQEDAMEAE
ncbi:cupin domain-containing protein [Halobacillus sp. A5]|uniref:cupin domain-containing protein n=1 Tax=Halobacillus sp. A5 TaxID=2880263 RepID=UPI0020A6BDA7|nr:cupin domain-containing protein [Halobacillus sp. A5]MCP3027130.1 cupin domain-containing protein [Halobacillus sp. A5]